MGGQATTAGTTFQENVCAWLACQVLLGDVRATPLLGLSPDVTLEDVVAESIAPVDDLKCRTSENATLYLQCKTDVSVGAKNAAFRSVWTQFVRKYVDGLVQGDRLVLAVGNTAPSTIRNDLKGLFDRLRYVSEATRHDAITALPVDLREQLKVVDAVVDSAFSELGRPAPNDSERTELYSAVHVLPFDFSADGFSTREAIQALQNYVLVQPSRGEEAWNAVVALVRGFAPDRTGGDRARLRLGLERLGLASDRAFLSAIETLRARSSLFQEDLRNHVSIPFGANSIQIARPIVDLLIEEATHHDVLVVGEAGAGKSGCLAMVAERLRDRGDDVVFLPVDDLDTGSLARLTDDLRLPVGNTFVETLAAWTGTGEGFLVIDALDAARTVAGARTLQQLIARIRNEAPRWRIIASIREYDLEKSKATQSLFEGELLAAPGHPRFPNKVVVYVEQLTDSEIEQVTTQEPRVGRALQHITLEMRELVRNIFNLRLTADLVAKGITSEELGAVRTQLQLLDEYWRKRIEETDNSDERSSTLTLIADNMVSNRRLKVHDTCIADRFAVCDALASDNVLSLSEGVVPGAPRRLSFAHNVLFDYAVARLCLRDISDELIENTVLPNNHDLLLAIRPSFVMAFQRLWHASKSTFWERALRWTTHPGMPPVGRLITANVVTAQ